jgi:hypothetical protein
MNEERAQGDRLKAAFAALGEGGAPTAACPEPDRLWAAAAGEGTAEERQEVIDHTAGCASCATAFRLARSLAQTPAEATTATIVRFPTARRWLTRPGSLAALAAILVLAILVPSWWSRQSGPPPVLRNRGTSHGDHAIESQLPEGAALPRDQAVLRWSAGPPGSFYEIRVSTRQAQEVAVETGLETPRYRVPPESFHGYPSATIFYWQVTTRFPEGTSGTSSTFSFRLQ